MIVSYSSCLQGDNSFLREASPSWLIILTGVTGALQRLPSSGRLSFFNDKGDSGHRPLTTETEDVGKYPVCSACIWCLAKSQSMGKYLKTLTSPHMEPTHEDELRFFVLPFYHNLPNFFMVFHLPLSNFHCLRLCVCTTFRRQMPS